MNCVVLAVLCAVCDSNGHLRQHKPRCLGENCQLHEPVLEEGKLENLAKELAVTLCATGNKMLAKKSSVVLRLCSVVVTGRRSVHCCHQRDSYLL
jgi:hypothetical protein